MKPLDNPVLVGVIGAAQGIRGEVRVKPFTAEPEALADYGVLFDAAGQRFEVLSVRKAGNVIAVRFLGVNDRNQAEALAGTELFIDRSSLPDEELEEDEYFLTDLEGLEAFDSTGRSWGVITAIFDFGSGDLLELRQPGKKPVVIPFTTAAVPEVDIAGGWIVVDPEVAGLLGSENEGDEGDGEAEDPRRPSGGKDGKDGSGKGR